MCEEGGGGREIILFWKPLIITPSEFCLCQLHHYDFMNV